MGTVVCRRPSVVNVARWVTCLKASESVFTPVPEGQASFDLFPVRSINRSALRRRHHICLFPLPPAHHSVLVITRSASFSLLRMLPSSSASPLKFRIFVPVVAASVRMGWLCSVDSTVTHAEGTYALLSLTRRFYFSPAAQSTRVVLCRDVTMSA